MGKKVGLLGLGCAVWIVAVVVLLLVVSVLSGPAKGRASGPDQAVVYVAIAAYLLYAIRVLRP